MKRFYLIILLALIGPISVLHAQLSLSWNVAGTYTYTVSSGISSISVDMAGGQGGEYQTYGAGGNGGRVQCIIAVTSGNVLTINVGGQGSNMSGYTGSGVAGGFNGGAASGVYYCGAGGGASDIRNSGGTRLVIAGGGGGGSDDCSTAGGGGGGTSGVNGSGACTGYVSSEAGAGGSQTMGGAGATNGGGSGSLYTGGSGGFYYGGGGGGGYYGGGGGYYGSGGGGSSLISGPGVSNATTTSAYQPGTGYVNIIELCNPPGTISGSVPVCVGNTFTLHESATGGSWQSSNPAIASINSAGLVTGVSAGNATITYVVNSPCGGSLATATVTVNPLPLAISGNNFVCNGLITSLSDPTSGGTWISSNSGIASIGATSGTVQGIAVGSANITYLMPTGCMTSETFTVNGAPAAPIVPGSGSVCVGSSITLNDITSNGSWSSSNTSLAIVGAGTGILTGLAYGIDTVSYTLSTGCSSMATIIVNPQPAYIGGIPNVCIGSSVTLTDATAGGNWNISNPGLASINNVTGVLTGIVAGSATVTYTLGSTGCRSTLPIVVESLPAPIVGASQVCIGGSATLTDATSGGTWSSSNPSIANVGPGTGIVTGGGTGSAVISYILLTGCTVSAPIVINPAPTAFSVTGGGSYCSNGNGSYVGLSYGSAGVNYQLYLGGASIGSPIAGSNASLSFGLQTATGNYSVVGTNITTGCSATMSGFANVSIVAAPTAFDVTGGGPYCTGGTGVPVTTDGSTPGIKYQLYNNGSPVGGLMTGTGYGLNFGMFTTPGTYTITGTSAATTCTSAMNGSTIVSINPPPTAYPVSGGGNYCASGAGRNVILLSSDPGIRYQVMKGSVVEGSVISSGGYLNLGVYSAAGVYSVTATDPTTNCTNTMNGTATININPTPTAYNVTPISPTYFCTGGNGVHVGLNYSTAGIQYVLFYAGSPLDTAYGSGSSLDFGLETNSGSYSVIATNPTTGCSSSMTGAASIGVNPLPNAYGVTGGGNICLGSAGVNIGMSTSDAGVNYQLYRGTTMVGTPMAGTGSSLSLGTFTNAGTYTVVGTSSSTNCSINQTGSAVISVNPLPIAYNVTGGGSFCVTDSGAHIMLSNSQTGVMYHLYQSGTPTSAVATGTGTSLDFGLQTAVGSYVVVATNTATGCQSNMNGSASIIVNPTPTVFAVTGGGNYCIGGAGKHVGLNGSNSGIGYQLYSTGIVGAPTAGTGAALDFGSLTATGTYTVIAKNMITGCTASMTGSATIGLDSLPAPYPVSGGGGYCANGVGVDVSLPGSDVGTNYQLFNGVSPVGSAVAGSGRTLDFGLQTAVGNYTVKATNGNNCVSLMPGSAPVLIITPTVYPVAGGGSFCANGSGVSVSEPGSSPTETYQLYLNWVPVGAPVSGTGSAINFGPQTGAGTYNIVATNSLYGCTDTMSGSATIVVNSLPAASSVGGGGNYCAGSAGEHVTLAGSSVGVNYQLFDSTMPVGRVMTGTGFALDFGAQTAAGTYTIIATNASTMCADSMTGNATISILPAPTPYIVGIDNSGYYCASDSNGVHIYLGGSDAGDTYHLLRGTTSIATITGTGSPIDFGRELVAGNYTIVASATSSCSATMAGTVTVTILPLPIVYDVTGGGSFCPSAPGVHIGLSSSQLGIRYTISKVGDAADSSSIYGSGSAIDFGVYNSNGTYTVSGTSYYLLTGCSNSMLGDAVVSQDTIFTPTVSLVQYPNNGVGVFNIDSMHAFVANAGANPTYQWIINGHIIPGATASSFTHYQFFNGDSVSVVVTATGPCGGNTTTEYVNVKLKSEGVQTVIAQNGDVKLIPNPNKGTFTVKGNIGTTDEEVTMEVTNMLGQVVYSSKAQVQSGNIEQSIQLSNVANGMYLMSLHSESGNTVIHFVVEQ